MLKDSKAFFGRTSHVNIGKGNVRRTCGVPCRVSQPAGNVEFGRKGLFLKPSTNVSRNILPYLQVPRATLVCFLLMSGTASAQSPTLATLPWYQGGEARSQETRAPDAQEPAAQDAAALQVQSQPADQQQPDTTQPPNTPQPPNTTQQPNTTPQQVPPPDAPQAKKPNDDKNGTSKDRIFWALPNFLTLEDADKVPPLTTKQKFKVVAQGVFDPSEFLLVGVVAGIGQASDSNPSYGQGFQGYAKRYGTAYGDTAIENFMVGAIFPSILRQDPRYFQSGQGGFWRRTGHAVSRVFITRTDAGGQQINYSELVGGLGAAAISNYTYHPQSDRGFGNVSKTWGTQIGFDVGTYMLKEFWPDIRKHYHNDAGAAGQTSNSK